MATGGRAAGFYAQLRAGEARGEINDSVSIQSDRTAVVLVGTPTKVEPKQKEVSLTCRR